MTRARPLDHPLDRPVWSALTSRQAPLALGDARALQFDPTYGPFAAAQDARPESQGALTELTPGGDGLWLVETEALAAPAGFALKAHAVCNQMIATQITPGEVEVEVTPLTEGDAAEMLALALMTRPGPFSTLTHRLGSFIGVKVDGRLAAMAGERMQPTGFCEVSGVCTLPEHRGKGYAAGLMRIVARRILARGETPFLHTYASNAGAIRLYESLGFTLRRPVTVTVLTPATVD
jgi:ribosomal protein S18 acetylase RimI-like enzyme